jgi:hypothetical protein
LVFCIIIHLSCSINSNKDVENIPPGQSLKVSELKLDGIKLEEILIDNSNNKISTNIVSEIEYVKLETSPESLIGSVDKLICTDDYIYILDNTFSNNLFVFSRKGKFISKISNKGEGPNEINQPYDFIVDNNKEEIAVYDGVQSKVVFYDYSLKPKRQKKLFARFKNFRQLNNGRYLVSTLGFTKLEDIANYQFLELDTTFNVIKKGIPFNENYNYDFTVRDNFHQNNANSCYWASPFQNQIYCIDSSANVKGGYKLNFEKLEIPKDLYKKDISEIYKYSQEHNKYVYLGKFAINTKTAFFLLSTRLTRDLIFVFKDLNSEKYIYGKIISDNKSLPLFSYPISSYKDKFCSIIESATITSFGENKQFISTLNLSKELAEIINTTKDSDNPVIQFYKITP